MNSRNNYSKNASSCLGVFTLKKSKLGNVQTVFFSFLFFCFCHLSIYATSPSKIKTLFNSLDPQSIAEHLAFYHLYSTTHEGEEALRHAWNLISKNNTSLNEEIKNLPFSKTTIEAIIGLVNKQPGETLPLLGEEELKTIGKLAAHLPNRSLKGFYATSEEDVLSLDPSEIDLARSLFLTELEDNEINSLAKVHSYEAMIDLMALQIMAKLPKNASPEIKIRAINEFIFEEMRFRFPPHSKWAKNIDIYTFLPSVLDSHRGVCLGVSILYLCIAQRLDLKLEMITPPGHIFVRYHDGDKIINIETTARGINLDSEEYLSIDTRSLQERNIKDVIGLAHYNQASVYWQQEDHHKALRSYLKAKQYLPQDKLLNELLAYSYLLTGNNEKGEELLKSLKGYIPDYAVSKDPMVEDYLNGKVDINGIKAIFMHVDETRESIIKKQQALEDILKSYPQFRTGIFCLATTWLQLHREKEALDVLERYHEMHPNDPTSEYYLAVLYGERFDYNKAWTHLRNAENLVLARQHNPKVLKELRKELSFLSPE